MGTKQEMEEAEIGAILNTVKYLKYDVGDDADIQDIIKDATTNGENKKPEELESIQKIQAAIDNNPELLNLKIGNQSVKMEGYDTKESGGLDACTFSNGDEVYVVYRGTGDAEWIDNGEGLSGNPKYVTGTDRQKQALSYFDEIMGGTNGYASKDTNLYLTGHSKGGNKAQYVTLESQYADQIDQCLSYDGQGMSPEYIAEYKRRYGEEAFERAVEKMYAHCADNDYVSPLGVTIIPKDHRTYYETPGMGDADGRNHFADACLSKEGGLTPETQPPHERGPIGRLVEGISEKIMQEDNDGIPTREDLMIGAMGTADQFLGGKVGMDERIATFQDYAAAAGYALTSLIPKEVLPPVFGGGSIGLGNKFKLEFSELESAARLAQATSENTAAYAKRIRNYAMPQITDISGGMSAHLTAASECLESKASKLDAKAEALETYATKLTALREYAKEADAEVKSKASTCFTQFANHNNIKVSKVTYTLLSWFHDRKDNSALGRLAEYLENAVTNLRQDVKNNIKKWWNEGGGKFIASIGTGVLATVGAIAGIVVAIGAIATAPVWATIAAVVGGTIGIASGITAIAYAGKAYAKNQEGDLGWATRQNKVKKASDALRKDSEWEYADAAANILDGTELVCDVTNIVHTISKFELVGNNFATRESADIRLFADKDLPLDKKPRFHYTWDSIKEGIQNRKEINVSERSITQFKLASKIDAISDVKTELKTILKPLTKFGHQMDSVSGKIKIGKKTMQFLELGKSANDLYKFGKGGVDLVTQGKALGTMGKIQGSVFHMEQLMENVTSPPIVSIESSQRWSDYRNVASGGSSR